MSQRASVWIRMPTGSNLVAKAMTVLRKKLRLPKNRLIINRGQTPQPPTGPGHRRRNSIWTRTNFVAKVPESWDRSSLLNHLQQILGEGLPPGTQKGWGSRRVSRRFADKRIPRGGQSHPVVRPFVAFQTRAGKHPGRSLF